MNKDRALNELYRLATNCAEFNHNGCNCQCGQCGYNVYLYTNERDATLIKSNAYADYQRHENARRDLEATRFAKGIAPLILIGLVIGLIAWGCHSCL